MWQWWVHDFLDHRPPMHHATHHTTMFVDLGVDCGAFVCGYMVQICDAIANKRNLQRCTKIVTQSCMGHLRQHIAFSCVANELVSAGDIVFDEFLVK
jgi:hypothetical protein